MAKRLAFLTLILLFGFTACAQPTPTPTPTPTSVPEPTAVPVQPVTGMPQGTDGYPWWNDSVFYEIFVRSFYDSNGDGIGDFSGITEKLDYLNDGDSSTTADLGVTGIWLMPINPSPSYHGYDVTDYYAVNPDYGTMDDFKNLLNEAHKRGIRVIMDMVLNHTSSKNPWFVGSWDPASPYHDWYVWLEAKPAYNGPWGQKVWYPSHGQYYYALFWDQMPDLNYTNPAVTAEMDNVIRFWLTDVGVDGFRLDAIKYMVEEGANMQNTGSTHAWLQQFRTVYKGANPEAMTVGEVAGDNALVLASYTGGDQLDLTFEFSLASAFVDSANQGSAGTAIGQLKLSYKLIPDLQFAPFLTNHDQDRLMSQLGDNPNKVMVAASMLLTAPGTPFIYYGEEIGLEGRKPDESLRRPMQWSAEKSAGFSTSSPWESVGPDYQTYNVTAETTDPTSLLAHYRTLIQLRNQHAALRVGDVNVVRSDNPGLYTILRLSQGEQDEAVLVLINLSDIPVTNFSLTLQSSKLAAGTYLALPLMGTGPFAELTVTNGGGFTGYRPLAEIPPYATMILQLQLK
jgi:glycosidase